MLLEVLEGQQLVVESLDVPRRFFDSKPLRGESEFDGGTDRRLWLIV